MAGLRKPAVDTRRRLGAIAAGVAMGAILLTAGAARAADLRRLRHPKDLSPQLKEQLADTLSDRTETFFAAEQRKHEEGKPYVDLQSKFEYLPSPSLNGNTVVSAKLGGAEYNPASHATPKGAATGKLKYLVLTYALVKGKWVEIRKPKWEVQDLGAEGAKKMTASAERASARRAAQARLKARAEAIQKALNQETGKTR